MRRVAGFVVMVGTAALAACATQAPAPAPVAAAAPVAVLPPGTPTLALVAANSPTAAAAAKPVPYGYTRVILDSGEVRFCRNDVDTGSRVTRKKVCLTQEQLDASQKNSQDFIDQVQQHGGASTLNGTPGVGGAMGH
jgi:hypothetical protein